MTSTNNKGLERHNIETIESMLMDEGIEMSPHPITMLTKDGLYETYYTQSDYNKLKRENNALIEQNKELQAKLSEYSSLSSNAAKEDSSENKPQRPELVYDTSIVRGDTVEEKDAVVYALIDLLNYKKSSGYLMTHTRCWYAAYRCLKTYNFLDANCNLTDFIELINDTVLEHIDDKERRKQLFCKLDNFKNIKEDHPLRQNDPKDWDRRSKYNKGLTSLSYAIIIKKYLNNKLHFTK